MACRACTTIGWSWGRECEECEGESQAAEQGVIRHSAVTVASPASQEATGCCELSVLACIVYCMINTQWLDRITSLQYKCWSSLLLSLVPSDVARVLIYFT